MIRAARVHLACSISITAPRRSRAGRARIRTSSECRSHCPCLSRCVGLLRPYRFIQSHMLDSAVARRSAFAEFVCRTICDALPCQRYAGLADGEHVESDIVSVAGRVLTPRLARTRAQTHSHTHPRTQHSHTQQCTNTRSNSHEHTHHAWRRASCRDSCTLCVLKADTSVRRPA